MTIRAEKADDFDKIHQLVKTAFETASPAADGDEQDHVLRLRASNNYIPQLALVAEDEGQLIGHIMLTKTYIKTKTKSIESLLLSPLAVLLPYRKKGIGARLVTEALARAKAAEYKAVFLVGEPKYYQRFGFVSVSNYNLAYNMDIPKQYVMVCELQVNWLKNIKGEISIV